MTKIDIIIPVLDEEIQIPLLLDYLAGCPDIDQCTITVIDGGSEDKTVEILKEKQVRFLETEESRAIQMNAGVASTKSEILYFIHADSRPPQSFVSDILEKVNEGYKIGCYRFVFDSRKLLLRMNSWFTQFDKMWCRGGDQTMFITRAFFAELGGYSESFVVMEEYDLIKKARRTERFCIIPKSVLVSPRKYSTNSWLKVQIANLTAFRMYQKGVDPKKIKKRYKELLNKY